MPWCCFNEAGSSNFSMVCFPISPPLSGVTMQMSVGLIMNHHTDVCAFNQSKLSLLLTRRHDCSSRVTSTFLVLPFCVGSYVPVLKLLCRCRIPAVPSTRGTSVRRASNTGMVSWDAFKYWDQIGCRCCERDESSSQPLMAAEFQ